ncbi:hypothetical protein GCM10010965_27620 [Caldalkalibacillus thermarum]|uniref:type II secretion system F family protein n=1 Tax=Caldalkalibacillus thermarum TaxID=296745 RepID=UPI001665C787|nr:type II secretion system F family protein [Caldalkalibacillus thermarum]GGK33232.1 hypothetical protein GCM10010965_27620 [Caldalkalibacillus thermarum]
MVALTSFVIAGSLFLAINWFFGDVLVRRKILDRTQKKETTVIREPEWFQPIADIRDASGIDMPFSRWLLLSLAGIVLGVFIGAVLLKNPVVGLILGLTLMGVPTWFLNYKAVQYREKVSDGLVPAFETFYSEYSLTRNLAKSFDLTAHQAPEPARGEFERMAAEIYAGYPSEDVLKNFARRMNNRWVRLFTSLLILHEKKGSDVTDSMLNLISEMKKRQIQTKKERTEMAQVRTVHMILMISAVALFIFNLVTRPESYGFFTADPQGRIMMTIIVTVLLISLVIFLWMNRKEVD